MTEVGATDDVLIVNALEIFVDRALLGDMGMDNTVSKDGNQSLETRRVGKLWTSSASSCKEDTIPFACKHYRDNVMRTCRKEGLMVRYVQVILF